MAPSLLSFTVAPSTTAWVVSSTRFRERLPAPARLKEGAVSDLVGTAVWVPPWLLPPVFTQVMASFTLFETVPTASVTVPTGFVTLPNRLPTVLMPPFSVLPFSGSVPLEVTPPATLTAFIRPVVSAFTLRAAASIWPLSSSSSLVVRFSTAARLVTSMLFTAAAIPAAAAPLPADRDRMALFTLVLLYPVMAMLPL